MRLYVLLREKRFLTTGDFECSPLFAGTESQCREHLHGLSEAESLDFDMADPETWIDLDSGDGNDGEVETVYEIKTVAGLAPGKV